MLLLVTLIAWLSALSAEEAALMVAKRPDMAKAGRKAYPAV